jgi:hypothetical protein
MGVAKKMKVKLHPDMLKAKQYKKLQDKINEWSKKYKLYGDYFCDQNRCLQTGISIKCSINMPFPIGNIDWVADVENNYMKVYNKKYLSDMYNLAEYLGLETIYKYYVE